MLSAARRVGLLLLVSSPLLPVEEAWARQEVAPDRPDLTNSTQTIMPGGFQLEVGVEYERTRQGGSPTERRLALQTTLRAGLSERLEVFLDAEPVVWLRRERDDLGNGDVTLGLKYRFFEPSPGERWPALGLQPFAKLPTANTPIGTERPDFAFLFLATQALPWGFNLDLNAGLAALGQRKPEGVLLQAQASGSLSYALTPRLSAFTELFFFTKDQRNSRELLGMSAGGIYVLTTSLAVDLGMRTTLTGRGPDWSVVTGFSVRWGR